MINGRTVISAVPVFRSMDTWSWLMNTERFQDDKVNEYHAACAPPHTTCHVYRYANFKDEYHAVCVSPRAMPMLIISNATCKT